MKYVYFPTGREIWLAVPEWLSRERGWEPTIWLGDDRHRLDAQRIFPGCTVYSFRSLHEGELQGEELPAVAVAARWLLSEQSQASLKLRVFKMMDRYYQKGRQSHREREARFYQLLDHFGRQLASKEPKALIAAEAPHSPAQMIIYELMRAAGLPTVHFSSMNSLPVMLVKAGIDAPPMSDPGDNPALTDERFIAKLSDFIHALEHRDYDKAEPEYMKWQRHSQRSVGLRDALRRRLWVPGGTANRGRLSRRGARFPGRQATNPQVSGHRSRDNYAGRASSVSGKARGGIPSRVSTVVGKYRSRRRAMHELVTAYERYVSELTSLGEYVFVPLHFEPERTTNPEGGEFWNQYDFLCELRGRLPLSIQLRVREHPSQFSMALRGERGRSPAFYSLVNDLPNTVLVPTGGDPIALMEGSMFVASIGGTSALEAAILGKRALIFGHPWFEGCPGITKFTGGDAISEALSPPRHDTSEIWDFLAGLVRTCGVAGCVNPSNERQFAEFEDLLFHRRASEWTARAIVRTVELGGRDA